MSIRQVSNWIYHKKNRPKSEFRLDVEKKLFLLEFYSKQSHPSVAEIQSISEKINVPVSRIKRWFYRNRHTEKKKSSLEKSL